jgi:hypothetical protein
MSRVCTGADAPILLPCPYCGGAAKFGEQPEGVFINCPECLASTGILIPQCHTQAEAAEAWNRRAAAAADLVLDAAEALLAGEVGVLAQLHGNPDPEFEPWPAMDALMKAMDQARPGWRQRAVAP